MGHAADGSRCHFVWVVFAAVLAWVAVAPIRAVAQSRTVDDVLSAASFDAAQTRALLAGQLVRASADESSDRELGVLCQKLAYGHAALR